MTKLTISSKDLEVFKIELITELRYLLTSKSDPLGKTWLKSSDVCKLLDISDGTLQKLRLKGVLKYSKIGNIFYYNAEDIRSTLQNTK